VKDEWQLALAVGRERIVAVEVAVAMAMRKALVVGSGSWQSGVVEWGQFEI
jgi:hypothetical protein